MKFVITGLLALMLIVSSGCLSSGPAEPTVNSNSIFVSPYNQNVNVGDTVTVYVELKEVQNVLGYQFDLSYDPDVLEFTGASGAGFLEMEGHQTFFVNPDSSVAGELKHVAEAALRGGEGISGSGKLAGITFVAKKAGTSSLVVSGEKIINKDNQEISLEKVPGMVTVS
jgi:hypothetical protein